MWFKKKNDQKHFGEEDRDIWEKHYPLGQGNSIETLLICVYGSGWSYNDRLEMAFSKIFSVSCSFHTPSLTLPSYPHPFNPSCPISLLSPSYCLCYFIHIWDGISKQFNVSFSHMTNDIKYFRKENIRWLFVLLLLRTVCSVDLLTIQFLPLLKKSNY